MMFHRLYDGWDKMKDSTVGRQAPRFELIAGNVCLDFINTLDNRPSEPPAKPTELLRSYADLVRFGQQSGLLDGGTADSLLRRAGAAPKKAREALRKAIELREAMYHVFMAIVETRSVPAGPLRVLNTHIQEAAGQARLVQGKGRFEWRFDSLASLGSVRWIIARAAGELLVSDQLGMVRACSSSSCRWLFLDSSKNHHRRWCNMKVCGNREKARKFYAKKKSA
jgi:predicted RNA-binding Zn ribbon-like protein